MEDIYNQIVTLLNSKGEKLGMNANEIHYTSSNDPGSVAQGYITKGISETITIPDDYMKISEATNATEFVNWLRIQ